MLTTAHRSWGDVTPSLQLAPQALKYCLSQLHARCLSSQLPLLSVLLQKACSFAPIRSASSWEARGLSCSLWILSLSQPLSFAPQHRSHGCPFLPHGSLLL